MPTQLELRIVFPSSPCDESILRRNISDLEEAGFQVRYDIPPPNTDLPFLSSSFENRLNELTDALVDKSDSPILCARGGYGASDLLSFLPWGKLKSATPKWLVGFSDVSALQSALFSKLGWPSIHGPMPGTDLWGESGTQDIDLLYKLLRDTKKMEGSIRIQEISRKNFRTGEGWLFGGCLSVLCNLIGTPYFPHSLRGAFLFLEDTGENPGKVLRMINQLIMSGILESCSGLIVSQFEDSTMNMVLQNEIANRVHIPVYVSSDFGHVSPNFPLGIGANAEISQDKLHWTYGV